MRKRTNNDGTETFQVLFRVGSKQTSRTFATEKAAIDFNRKIEVLGARRALLELEELPSGPTLDELAAEYWPYRASRVRSDRTVADYERDYRNWISPKLGHLSASSIDESDVQAWVDSMQKARRSDGSPRLSPKSIADKHAILHGIFKWACSPTRKRVPVGHNPAIGTDLPKRPRKLPQGLQPAEWQAFHIALRQIDPHAADLALFLVAAGCRWSEATALDTYAIEDNGERIWVTFRQVARRNAANQVRIVHDTKSDAGGRRIKLDVAASQMVRERIAGLPAGSLVFTTANGAVWDYGHFRDRKWKPALEVANLNRHVTIHMLRHTAVGYLALSGMVNIAEIQRRIGHASVKTTIDVYGGMIEDVSDDAVDFLGTMRDGSMPHESVRTIAAMPELTDE